MAKFIFQSFTLKEADNEVMVFGRGTSEICLDGISPDLNWIPMAKVDFHFISSEESGKLIVDSFELDKFDILHLTFVSKGDSPYRKVLLSCHLDAFQVSDMEFFRRGTPYNLEIEG